MQPFQQTVCLCKHIFGREMCAFERKPATFALLFKSSAMKRNLTTKSFVSFVIAFSLSAFVFVNLHASLTVPQQNCTPEQMGQVQIKEECDDTETREIPVPDVTAISRLIELAQKLLPLTN